jgi:plasmid replication initiation protein
MNNTELSRGGQIVVKANKLVEARYKLTLNEQRIILSALTMISPDDEEFGTYTLEDKHFKEKYGVNNYLEIEEAVKRLRTRKIVFEDENGDLIDANWVSAAKYYKKRNKTTIEFPRMLKHYLLQLRDNFTWYRESNLYETKSSYTIRIFELCRQYRKIGKRTITIKRIKEILQIPADEYALFGHFNDRVLKVAKKQINSGTEIKISYIPIKEGRKVVAVEFTIQKQAHESEPQMILPGMEQRNTSDTELYDELVKWQGVSQAESNLKKYGEEVNKANFKLFLKEKERLEIRDPKKWLGVAITQNYAEETEGEKDRINTETEKDIIMKKLNSYRHLKKKFESQNYHKTIEEYAMANKIELQAVEKTIDEYYKKLGRADWDWRIGA